MESFIDGWGKTVIEVRNGLTAMLLVLVGLKDNCGESGSGTNGLRGAEEAMTSVKTFFKELADVGLAASKGTGG